MIFVKKNLINDKIKYSEIDKIFNKKTFTETDDDFIMKKKH